MGLSKEHTYKGKPYYTLEELKAAVENQIELSVNKLVANCKEQFQICYLLKHLYQLKI